jgi:hypothetical protein
MLPFSGKKQAQIIRQLEQHWKAWITQDAFSARRVAATHARQQWRRFLNMTRSSVLLYHLLLFIQHVPIDTLDVLAKRCSSWRRGTKFESVFSEMQNKFRLIQIKFRRI